MLEGIRRSRVTIAVVVCTFTAASVAAYQVYNAVCAQESAAQRALLSHARFAAWTFTREADVELERAARRVLAPTVSLAAGHAASIAPSVLVAEGIRAARRCACVSVPDVRFTFTVDLTRDANAGRIATRTAKPSNAPVMPNVATGRSARVADER